MQSPPRSPALEHFSADLSVGYSPTGDLPPWGTQGACGPGGRGLRDGWGGSAAAAAAAAAAVAAAANPEPEVEAGVGVGAAGVGASGVGAGGVAGAALAGLGFMIRGSGLGTDPNPNP